MNALARRERRVLATPELRRRKRLTKREHLLVYAMYWLTGAGVSLVLGAVAVEALTDGLLLDLAAAGCIIAATGMAVWGVAWWIWMYDNQEAPDSPKERRFQAFADRNRRHRAHKDDEKTRLRDVNYTRYSVWVERDNNEIKLSALAHRRTRTYGLRWRAAKTKKLWNAQSGTWENPDRPLSVIQLGQDDALEVLGHAQLIAEQLESEAYAQALKEHQVDCMAVALQPPPLSARTWGRLESARDDMDRLLEEILDPESKP